jgi:hypothetical protein
MMDTTQLPRVSLEGLPDGPDPVAAWIRLDRITRRMVGRRMRHGPTPETDEALDKLMVLRAWTTRRLLNWVLP